jgi:hypothetical protein
MIHASGIKELAQEAHTVVTAIRTAQRLKSRHTRLPAIPVRVMMASAAFTALPFPLSPA